MGHPVEAAYAYLREPYGTTAGRSFPHTGDDWSRRMKNGQPIQAQPKILAVYSGTVIDSSYHAQAGNRIVILYWYGGFGVYAHNARNRVATGAKVTEGQHIADMGATGKVTGPHLHYSQYTSRSRALSGIVQYWQGVKWASVDAWATASGLQRPDYRARSKADNKIEEEDDMYDSNAKAVADATLKIVGDMMGRVKTLNIDVEDLKAKVSALEANDGSHRSTLNRIETNVAINKWALTSEVGVRSMLANLSNAISEIEIEGAAVLGKVTLADGEEAKIAKAVADEQYRRQAE